MLFHVHMTVRLPFDLDPKTAKTLGDREHARAKELQDQGKWVHLWRIAGKTENISVFDVESPGELHELLASMAFFPFMDIAVSALCHHPGSVKSNE